MVKLPKHSQTIQPYMFGEPYSKKTYLWLKGLPFLEATKYSKYNPYVTCRKITPIPNVEYKPHYTAKERSKSFEKVANAMAEQWSDESNTQLAFFPNTWLK